MPYFTDDPIRAEGLSILDAPVSFGEAIGAAAEQSFSTSITPLLFGAEELVAQEQGQVAAQTTAEDPFRRVGPSTPLLSREQASERVKESGLELDIPESGMREGALNLLLERRRAERERSILMQNAPDSATIPMFLASFAAQAVDPINIASAFIPVVGEARYTAMLAGATSIAARLGVRAGVGAVEGAVGAAVLEPAVYTLSRQLQDDYDITDSLTNIAFGAVLGGSLRGVGGLVKDRYFPSKALEIGDALDDMPAQDRSALAQAGYLDDAGERLTISLERGLEIERAQSLDTARERLLPQIRVELEELAAGRISGVKAMRQEVASISQQIDVLPESFKQRAKTFQGEGLSRKSAERAARDAIAGEREGLAARREELTNAIEQNRSAELAKAELRDLDAGQIPARFMDRLTIEADAINAALQPKRLVQAVSPISFADKHEAFRFTLGSVLNGYDVEPRVLMDLKSPDANVRQGAIDILKNPPRRMPREYAQASLRAEQQIRETPDDQAFQDNQSQFDEDVANEIARQTGYDLAADAEVREAVKFAKEIEAYNDVYRANALCMLRI